MSRTLMLCRAESGPRSEWGQVPMHVTTAKLESGQQITAPLVFASVHFRRRLAASFEDAAIG